MLDLRDRDRQIGTGAPVLTKYERVAFDRANIRVPGQPNAQLIAPGHPLLDAIVDLVIERHRRVLKHGSVLLDPNDPSESPRLLVALTHTITNGHPPPNVVSKRFQFVELTSDGDACPAGPAPYLDYTPLSEADLVIAAPVTQEPWLAQGAEHPAMTWAITQAVPEHEEQVTARVTATVDRTRREVHQRLTSEINYWDNRAFDLRIQEEAGKTLRLRPETAEKRSRDLEGRLEKRMAELVADEQLVALPPVIDGAALVIPQGLLDRLRGARAEPAATYAKETAAVERRAVDAVLAAERALGRDPEEMPHNNPGYDVRSVDPEGRVIRIEVKGRIEGSDDFVITRNEVLTAKNLGDDYRLAMVL
ncbi:MAG TPA: DUF3883 domain-containing protein, partial [Acidothermaceae bacterium]|nr:DUF3883 domain-containing protein [Acidothermaceae bacterium]